MEASEGKSCFGNRERRAHLVELSQLLVGVEFLGCTQIDAPQRYPVFFRRLDIDLQRRLSVELNGDVHHIAALHQTERRSVGPAACEVYAHRTAAPYYLIGKHGESRLLRRACGGSQPFTHQCKGLVLIFLLASQSVAEHGIADASQTVCHFVEWFRRRKAKGPELLGSIVEIHLIEHALVVVLCNHWPVH